MRKYDIASQLQYPNTPYRTKGGKPAGATIKSGGCGAASVRNLGNNLLSWGATIPTVAKIAVDCGARYDGGTTISTLLKAMTAKYGGFTYKYTTDDDAAFDAVRAGAMCIIHTSGAVGGAYNKLLSSSGHFMCLAEVDDKYGYIIDSCSYTGKWKAQANREKYCKLVQSDGLVRVTLAGIRAAIDYYYIVKKAAPSQTNPATEKKEEKYTVKNLEMQVNGSTQSIEAIETGGHNYVRLDQLPKLLPVDVGYNGKQPTMNTSTVKLRVDGEEKTLPGGIIAPGKSLAYISDLAQAFGYSVSWDAESKTVTLEKKK